MKKSVVSIVKTPKSPSEKEIDTSVRKAIELAGGLTDIISSGDTVLIKPNLISPSHPDTGTTTDPRVCKSIANMVREIGAKPIIAESSGIGTDTEEAIKVAGYSKLRDDGFEGVFVRNDNGHGLGRIPSFQVNNFPDSFFGKGIASQTVESIGRIGDDPIFFQNIDDIIELQWVDCSGIDLENFSLHLSHPLSLDTKSC